VSYSFEVGDDMVWDPALRVGKLFLGQVQAAAPVLGLPSGLAPQRDGTCQVDPAVYAAFVAELQVTHLRSRHPEMLQLTKGLLIVAVGLLLRVGLKPPAGSDEAWEEILAEATFRSQRWP
jgi:hypothetical protein